MNRELNESDITSVPGIHANGHREYYNKTVAIELIFEEAKLKRRIRRFCSPMGILGNLFLTFRQLRIRRKLRDRLMRTEAMFIS